MDRDTVIRIVLGAGTLEECDHAEAVLREWMREHPRDHGVLEGGEQLMMTREALAIIAREEETARLTPAA
jgi:hypothetical protein